MEGFLCPKPLTHLIFRSKKVFRSFRLKSGLTRRVHQNRRSVGYNVNASRSKSIDSNDCSEENKSFARSIESCQRVFIPQYSRLAESRNGRRLFIPIREMWYYDYVTLSHTSFLPFQWILYRLMSLMRGANISRWWLGNLLDVFKA